MVRAILAGTKTQTRRIVNPQPDFDPWHHMNIDKLGPCKYGQSGDQLWVRETFRLGASLDNDSPIWSASSCVSVSGKLVGPIKYEADGATLNEDVLDDHGGAWGKTRVSIHMPRWASRINLLIKSIRVERLQDISEEDAKAEGVEPFFSTHPSIGRDQRMTSGELASDCEYRASYACLWDKINGADAWDKNPWVWVVEFEVIQ
jgi:hypothetical protein